ncbi:hypothetical protein QQ008_20830 [Fulvivirgaceae bacterium BMA10]|uniref:Outer membrane protein beta-barrel domain-containing protein n=1 Tax=Splendidivirga corallicola TaxID=3051826 RepID=A0ABT8KUL1_9BACT|nr:hypothetical protein [Fulvivirgaceae bacterium BMA10]
MKKVLLSAMTICLIAATSYGQSENYKPFKVGIGLGYAVPSDGGGGVAIYLEPAYRLKDAIAIGLRLESAVLAKTIGTTEASASGNASYTLNGQYYLSNAKFRPFVGLGLGIFSLASVSVNTNGTTGAAASGSEFGFYPRLGFDLGHFNFIFDYNIIPATKPEVTVGSIPDIKNSYFTIKIGASIGGGEK